MAGVPPELSDLDRVWLAAMIDGEGCISIGRSKREAAACGWRFVPSVTISNTDERIIDKFESLTECWITRKRSFKHNASHNPNAKPCWYIEIKYTAVGEFLEQIKEFLVGKKEQAENALEFLELQRGVGQRNFDLTKQFNELYIKSRLLNKRGLKPLNVEKLREDILQNEMEN